jgi:hypothetical protein
MGVIAVDRQGDKETRRQGEKTVFGLLVSLSPCLLVSLSRILLVSLSPCLLVYCTGCNQQPATPVVAGPASGDGWEIRYTAAIALARRGSDKLNDPHVRDLFLEMLDEQQQLRNARETVNGREVTDLAKAHGTTFAALDALSEYHRRNKSADLAPFKPAIDKITTSSNAWLANKAKTLQQELG